MTMMTTEELIECAAAMALAHLMLTTDQIMKMADYNTIRQCFGRIGDMPYVHDRVIDLAERYTSRVEDDGIKTKSERHEIEIVLETVLDYER
jgi:hypothetical protein